MIRGTASAMLLLLTWGQGLAAGRAAEAVDIPRLVRELGSPEFSVRRRASRLLWEQGRAAEEALQRAAVSEDREVRLRAERILSDFRYGILPRAPDEVIRLLRRFRDGDGNQRLAALQALAEQGEFDRVAQLIQLESSAEVRRQMLVYLMQNPRAVDHFLELERLEQLIAMVGADQERAWRRTILAQLLFSEAMIRRLSAGGRLDVLMRVLQEEESAEVRREMLSRLFQNPRALASLVEANQLDFVRELIVKEPQQAMRGQWIQRLLSIPEAVQQLVREDRFVEFMRFAGENVDEEVRSRMLQQALGHPQTVQALLNQRGLDGLLALAELEDQPVARGRLLASLTTSQGLRETLPDQAHRDLLLDLAEQQEEPAARNEYLKSMVASGSGFALFQSPQSRERIWELIQEESVAGDPEVADWRGEAIARLLATSAAVEVLSDAQRVSWLLGFLRDQALPNQRLQIMERLLMNHRFQELVTGDSHFEAVLELVQGLPDHKRGGLLGRLISARAVQRMAEANELERVVALASQEPESAARRAYLQRLFRDQAAMKLLLDAGLEDALWKLVQAETDPREHAILRGDFYSTSAAVQQLQTREQRKTLVDFAEQQDFPARREYLTRLLRNHRATSLLIDEGHYRALYSLAGSDPDADRRSTLLSLFYGHSRVLEALAADQQIGEVLEFAVEHLEGNPLGQFLHQICQQEAAVAALIDQGQLDTLLLLVRQLEENHFYNHLLRTLMASPPFVRHFAEQGEMGQLYGWIAGVSQDRRYQIWEGLLQRADNVSAILAQDGLDDLADHVRTEDRPERRGMLLGRLLNQPALVEHLVAAERTEWLLDVARREPHEPTREQLLMHLLNRPATIQALKDASQLPALYRLCREQTVAATRHRLLIKLLESEPAVQALAADGRLRPAIEELLEDGLPGASQPEDEDPTRQRLLQLLDEY